MTSSINSSSLSRSSSSDRSSDAEYCDESQVTEECRLAITIALKKLKSSPDMKDFEFPSSLNHYERAYIHKLCKSNNLYSYCKGKDAKKYIIASKAKEKTFVLDEALVFLSQQSGISIADFSKQFPFNETEKQLLTPKIQSKENNGLNEFYRSIGALNLSKIQAQVPLMRNKSNGLDLFRESLQISYLKDEILKLVSTNRVIIIPGDTNYGKTTQVPQYILDQHCSLNQSCKMLLSFPKRLAALSVAERISNERNEYIGETVGYEVENESNTSSNTVLLVSTHACLLKTLISADFNQLNTLTHIIMDEIHERTKIDDFLFILLKDLLSKNKNLKLILIGSPVNTELLSKYFNHCPVLFASIKLNPIHEYFLEDILKSINYPQNKKKIAKIEALEKWFKNPGNLTNDKVNLANYSIDYSKQTSTDNTVNRAQLDELIYKTCIDTRIEYFNQIFKLICENKMSVDYQHSDSLISPLMIASARGLFKIIDRLLGFGANIHLKSANDYTALDWARRFCKNEIMEYLEAYCGNIGPYHQANEFYSPKDLSECTNEERILLRSYYQNYNDDKIDIDLIYYLFIYLLKAFKKGSILIFLMDFNDVNELKAKILSNETNIDLSKLLMYEIDQNMSNELFEKAHQIPEEGFRKLVLATSEISESTLTISDVVYVIDCARKLEKTYDTATNLTSNKINWISKTWANLRKNKAGCSSPGYCYHLFTKYRFKNAQLLPIAEINKYPLQETCLHAKLIAKSASITDFISKAPESPQFSQLRGAISHLKLIDALDTWEDLTELGFHLTNLQIELKYGKMLLYSVVLKCFDPILTIAASSQFREPFILNNPIAKRNVALLKRNISSNTCSDHMVIIRLFENWTNACESGQEVEFCRSNNISPVIMKQMKEMRMNLTEKLKMAGFVYNLEDMNKNSKNWPVVKATLTAGMYPYVVRVDKTNKALIDDKGTKIFMHHSSVLSPISHYNCELFEDLISKLPSEWLICDQLTQHSQLTIIRQVTSVSPILIALFCGQMKTQQGSLNDLASNCEKAVEDKKVNIKLDNWINFNASEKDASLIWYLRQKWNSLLINRLKTPTQIDPNNDTVLELLVNCIKNEEQQ